MLTKLRVGHLHALPLCDDGVYRGWVSYDDVAHLFLTVLSSSSAIEGEAVPHAWTRSPEEVTAKGQKWILSPCSKLPKLTAWGEVYDHGTLAQLAEEMVDRQLHRIAIMTEKNVLHSVISATDLIGFISEHHALWSDLAGKTVSQLNLGSHNVISCSASQDFMQALYLMDANQVTAVAVTDASNRLIANVSSADLGALELHTNTFVPTTFRSLLLPVSSFLARTKGQPPLQVKLEGELANVVAQMAMFHVHRVWIVDDKHQPVGIITAFDVLKLFL